MSKSRSKSNDGFTLVEVLVVLVVISLLIALLMPSLSTAREVSRRAVCLSNARQLNLSLQLLAGDNKGWVNTPHNPYPNGPNYVQWPVVIRPYLSYANSGTSNWDYDVLTGWRFGTRGCPGRVPGPQGLWYSFGINTAFDGGPWYLSNGAPWSLYIDIPLMHSLNEVRNPDRLFLIAECAVTYNPWGSDKFDDMVKPRANDTLTAMWGPYARHNAEGLNFTYVDGHGRFVPKGGSTGGQFVWDYGQAPAGAANWYWYSNTFPYTNNLWSD